MQVEYIAYRDPDGNLISADIVDELTELSQERVPEDEVLSFAYSEFLGNYSCAVIDACLPVFVNKGNFLWLHPPFRFLSPCQPFWD